MKNKLLFGLVLLVGGLLQATDLDHLLPLPCAPSVGRFSGPPPAAVVLAGAAVHQNLSTFESRTESQIRSQVIAAELRIAQLRMEIRSEQTSRANLKRQLAGLMGTPDDETTDTDPE